MPADNFSSTFLRLRPDSSIEKLPVEGFWPRLMQGGEIVCLLTGRATLVMEDAAGGRSEIQLEQPGSFACIARGSWHTAKLGAASRFLFITSGEGTQQRPAQS